MSKTTSFLTNRYASSRKLGESELAEVFSARQMSTSGISREVVIKRFSARLSQEGRGSALVEEALVAAGLAHPGIGHVYDVGEQGGRYYIVREPCHGVTLQQLNDGLVNAGRLLPLDLAVTITTQILAALRHAHGFRDESGRSLSLVHRALGPDNVLVSVEGAVQLVDFGTAWPERFLRDANQRTPRHFAYIAPECGAGVERPNVTADVFSVGVLLYEISVGQRLFRRPPAETLAAGPLAPPTFARAEYPADLENIVMRALEREPTDRFGSAESMLEALEQFAADNGMNLSRLRLGRLVAEQVLPPSNALEPVDVESEQLERNVLGAEELDFDRSAVFEDGEQDEEPVALEPAAPPEVEGDGAGDLDAIHTADLGHEPLAAETGGAALFDEVTADAIPVADEPTAPRPLVKQRSPYIEVEPVAAGTTPDTVLTRRREKTVAVTDDLVEEEIDLDSSEADILVGPRPGRSAGVAAEGARARTSSYLRAALDEFDRAAGPGDPLVEGELDAPTVEIPPSKINTGQISAPEGSPRSAIELPGPSVEPRRRASVGSHSFPASGDQGGGFDDREVLSFSPRRGGVDPLEAADGAVSGDDEVDRLEAADREPVLAPTEVSEVLASLKADLESAHPEPAATSSEAGGELGEALGELSKLVEVDGRQQRADGEAEPESGAREDDEAGSEPDKDVEFEPDEAGSEADEDVGSEADEDVEAEADEDAGSEAGEDAGSEAGEDAGSEPGEDAGSEPGEVGSEPREPEPDELEPDELEPDELEPDELEPDELEPDDLLELAEEDLDLEQDEGRRERAAAAATPPPPPPEVVGEGQDANGAEDGRHD